MHTPTRLIGLASALVAVLVLSPAPVQGQFGGLVNKAKEKVAQKGAEQAGDKLGPVAPGEQLSEDLLGKVINGATAADRVLSERDKVNTARDAKNKELSALMDKNQPVHQAYNSTSEKILDCRSASFSNLEKARNERFEAQMKAKQSDPAFLGKMQLVSMKYGKAMADAQQKNDPVALQKAQTDMIKEILGVDIFPELKKDSVATDAKCGKAPAMPASLVQEEKLRKDVATADDSIRTLEAKAVNVGAQASGLEQIRYVQLKERALSIVNRLNNKGAAVKYGDDEMAAVRKRQADLEKLLRAL
jgi:small-conductance mechanosensitive channel